MTKLKNVALFLFTLLLVGSCKVIQPKTSPVKFDTTVFQTVLDSIYNAHPNSVGLMAHVEAPNKNISWSGAVGLSNKKLKTAVQADQPILIASNTKTYISVAILRLVEDGKLKITQPIEGYISKKTEELLKGDGYDLQAITIVHLLSHTSGIQDYVNDAYMERINSDPTHRWTRAEQIALSVEVGSPLALPGKSFSYADVNYLILTEIIESQTNKNFYTGVRDLIGFEKHHLDASWFSTLEDQPEGVKPLAYQYFSKRGWDSYSLDHSFDLYGGGGIAATSKDLARFFQLLFEGKIVKAPAVLDLIFTKIKIEGDYDPHYLLGLMDSKINEFQAYGHGGFWGTTVQYFPALNASISVFVLERDKNKLRKGLLEALVNALGMEKK